MDLLVGGTLEKKFDNRILYYDTKEFKKKINKVIHTDTEKGLWSWLTNHVLKFNTWFKKANINLWTYILIRMLLSIPTVGI